MKALTINYLVINCSKVYLFSIQNAAKQRNVKRAEKYTFPHSMQKKLT